MGARLVVVSSRGKAESPDPEIMSRGEFLMDTPSKVLVVSAHPDDVDFGCAGTVALWSWAGARVNYLICTDGEKGAEEASYRPQEIRAVRRQEQMAAARVVGVQDVVFLGFPDGELENSQGLRKELVRWIRKFKPEVVFCQDPANRVFENPYVSHRDHRMAAEAVFDALYPACGNPNFFPELLKEGLEPHKVKEAFFFGTHSPNHWEDISSVMELKVKAVLSHKSQLKDPCSTEKFLLQRFREIGEQVGVMYAEPFRRLMLPL
jgi:LmbE family N-acetylglucosaminyl deacetylase